MRPCFSVNAESGATVQPIEWKSAKTKEDIHGYSLLFDAAVWVALCERCASGTPAPMLQARRNESADAVPAATRSLAMAGTARRTSRAGGIAGNAEDMESSETAQDRVGDRDAVGDDVCVSGRERWAAGAESQRVVPQGDTIAAQRQRDVAVQRRCSKCCDCGNIRRRSDGAVIAVHSSMRRRGTAAFFVSLRSKANGLDRRNRGIVGETAGGADRAEWPVGRIGGGDLPGTWVHSMLRKPADARQQRQCQHRQQGESGHRTLECGGSRHGEQYSDGARVDAS